MWAVSPVAAGVAAVAVAPHLPDGARKLHLPSAVAGIIGGACWRSHISSLQQLRLPHDAWMFAVECSLLPSASREPITVRMSRVDQYGVRHVTADDPITPEGNAHIAACPECRAAFPAAAAAPPQPRRRRPWGILIPLWILALAALPFVIMFASEFFRGLILGR